MAKGRNNRGKSGKSSRRAPRKSKKAGARAPQRQAQARQGSTGGLKGIWARSVQFLREVRTELKKVTWPSKRQTISSTAAVIVLVVLVAIFLGAVDFLLARVVRMLVG